MPTPTNAWLTTIAEQEIQITSLKRDLSAERLANREHAATTARLQARLHALQAVSDCLTGLPAFATACVAVCQAAVRLLGWSSALIVRDGSVLASCQTTQGQLARIRRDLAKTPAFATACAAGEAISTFQSSDSKALSLRVLFATDDVAAFPLLTGKSVYGYLVVCAHGSTVNPASVELDFLAYLARTIARQLAASSR